LLPLALIAFGDSSREEVRLQDVSLQTVLNSGRFVVGVDDNFPPMSFTDESGETTYIRGIEAEQILKGAYNLQGQPVDTPTKGVYIINGKKVVIK
jgi:hypothetical protein